VSDTSRRDSARQFYDDLADTYDLIYADWERSMTRQASALDALIRAQLGEGSIRVLDCACGIGTQLIGLAALGHVMSGTDLSPAAVARADRECRARGLSAEVRPADMRDLPHADASFDVVVCADNSLPHLLTEGDVGKALRQMRRVVRPGGLVVVTTRDYDAVLADRPTTAPVQRSRIDGLRTVTTQLWDWREGSPVYDVTHLQVREAGHGQWVAASRTTTYRAWTRAELSALATGAGLGGVQWIASEDSGFFQPVMLARP
jgi:glycine/sarcosine N-methyltransferase